MNNFFKKYITVDVKKVSSKLLFYSVIDIKSEKNKLILVTDLENNMQINHIVSYFNSNDISKKTSHPNIVTLDDIGIIHEGFLSYIYIVFDAKIMLFNSMENSFKTNELTLERSLQIICQALNGLQFAHENNLIHRNIMTDSFIYLNNESKLRDFHRLFIPKKAIKDEQMKQLSYKPPEFFIDQSLYNYLSDIYSIGIVLFRCANQFNSWLDVIKQVDDLKEQVQTLNLINHIGYKNNVPIEIKRIINKACCYDSNNYYSSVFELQQDIKNTFDIK